MTTIEMLGVGIRVGCAILAWIFVLRYLRTDWHDNSGGRVVMALALLIGIFMTLVSLAVLADMTFPNWFIFGLYCALFAALVYLNVAFTQEQHRAERAEKEAAVAKQENVELRQENKDQKKEIKDMKEANGH